jgi:hypothetical protein
MAAIQYLIPGGRYVNEDTSQREFLIPGGSYLNETSTAAGGAAKPTPNFLTLGVGT